MNCVAWFNLNIGSSMSVFLVSSCSFGVYSHYADSVLSCLPSKNVLSVEVFTAWASGYNLASEEMTRSGATQMSLAGLVCRGGAGLVGRPRRADHKASAACVCSWHMLSSHHYWVVGEDKTSVHLQGRKLPVYSQSAIIKSLVNSLRTQFTSSPSESCW